MSLKNTHASFGTVTKTFHWLTALLILSALPLGFIARNFAQQISSGDATSSQSLIGATALLFTLHKTIGVSTFFVALARILWAMSQPKPGLLNGDKHVEAWAAETVHWLLYGSLLVVPLSGWIYHAATTGFAPIWWPFGQDLPFVPKDHAIAEFARALHYTFQWVLIGALVLHVAGALKHHVVDNDATLRRMLPGAISAIPTARQPGHSRPLVTALLIWAAALGGGAGMGWFSNQSDASKAPPPTMADTTGDWQVQDGTLNIEVAQMGATITGHFADWTAAITYDETPDDSGRQGSVLVTIAIPSLRIGTVTAQAMGRDYFDATTFPVATFSASLLSTESGHVASGMLTIRGQETPVDMPFTLEIDGQTAHASGSLTVDRRAFGIGKGLNDEKSLGFGVTIHFDLTASRP